MTTPNIPFSAWEQAVFVALIVVFTLAMIGGLLAWMDRQMQNLRSAQDKQQTSWQKFLSEENSKWQNFIRDERTISSGARKEDREKVNELTEAMVKLTEQVTAFHSEFVEHTVEERERFNALERQASFNHPRKGAESS